MVQDSNTNFLYLADTLAKYYPKFFKQFEQTLKNAKISFDFLPKTKDVWAVDYMPIQIDINKFVRFIYKPLYLKAAADLKTISNVDLICEEIGIKTLKSNILLEGGNVIRTTDKVIMTTRIFSENPSIEQKKLIQQLENIFQVDKLFIIPEYPNEMTGHADGLIRFLDKETVLINNFTEEEKEYSEIFENAVKKTGLKYIKIPYKPDLKRNEIQARGLYINYLQMEGNVFLPTFGLKEDSEVIKQFEQIFAGQNVIPVDSTDIANDGGILNCVTWNILKQ